MRKSRSVFTYMLASLAFAVLGALASFGVTALAQSSTYPVGALYPANVSTNQFYCDPGYTLTFFRYNEGTDNDANWWACQY